MIHFFGPSEICASKDISPIFVNSFGFTHFSRILLALESQRLSRSPPRELARQIAITSCTVHRTFRGAKRSTGAGLEQKLVQLASPGHAPAASPGCGFFLLPTPAISHPERESSRFFVHRERKPIPRRWEENERAATLARSDRRVRSRPTCVLDMVSPRVAVDQRRPWRTSRTLI